MAAADNDGNKQQWWWMTMATEDEGMQDQAAD
jgi:hypothetical protein